MSKKFFNTIFLFFMVFSALFMAGCSNTSNERIESDKNVMSESKQDLGDEKSVNEAKNSDNPKDLSINNSIKVAEGGTVWTAEENALAEKIANEFVDELKNKDMVSISKKIKYPIEIFTTDGKNMTVSNQKEFSSIAFDKVFDQEFIDIVGNSTELFGNWRGFMLGDGTNLIWMSPQENGEMEIYAIVTSHTQRSEDPQGPTK